MSKSDGSDIELPFCECGCGDRVTKPNNRFILGHHARVIDCAWSRGLTKLDHPGLRKRAEKIKGRTKENHPGIKAQSEKMKDIIPWMKGKTHTINSKEKMSDSLKKLKLVPWNKGKTKKDSKRLQKISKQFLGIKRGPNKEPFNNAIRRNQRLAAIKRIESRTGQCSPNYNPDGCKIIDEFSKEIGYEFMHAENGGEYYFKELGYWVDGFNEEYVHIIEIDESFHFNSDGNLSERDVLRQKEIEEYCNKKFGKCKFTRIKV